jgi:hypothetical protein
MNAPITAIDPFFVFGTNQLNVPIPPTGCLLLTDIVVAVPVAAGSRTYYALDVPVPPGLSGGQFFVQSLRAGVSPTTTFWHTTNGIDVTLP